MSAAPHDPSPFSGLNEPSAPPAPTENTNAFAGLDVASSSASPPSGASRSKQRRLPWSLKLLVVLIPYAVLLTVYTAFLLQHRPPHPLEQMADQGLYEDYLDGRKRLNPVPLDQAPAVKPAQEAVDPAIELPPLAPLVLGQTRRLGALDVTPLKVTRGRWTYAYKNATKDFESIPRGLLLHLRCKNVSDTIFAPHDPTFNRASGKYLVYTYLTVGSEKFFGPVGDPSRERIKGQDFGELLPGQRCETLILAVPQTGPHGDLLAEIDKLPKDTVLTWRVHLRRGQEKLSGAKGERAVWVTMVVPVQFRASEIQAE